MITFLISSYLREIICYKLLTELAKFYVLKIKIYRIVILVLFYIHICVCVCVCV
jgi:hypothetical protein